MTLYEQQTAVLNRGLLFNTPYGRRGMFHSRVSNRSCHSSRPIIAFYPVCSSAVKASGDCGCPLLVFTQAIKELLQSAEVTGSVVLEPCGGWVSFDLSGGHVPDP